MLQSELLCCDSSSGVVRDCVFATALDDAAACEAVARDDVGPGGACAYSAACQATDKEETGPPPPVLHAH